MTDNIIDGLIISTLLIQAQIAVLYWRYRGLKKSTRMLTKFKKK